MKQKIKILYIEHLRSEADLIETRLKKSSMQFESLLVYTKEKFTSALKQFAPDIVIADNYVSAFNSTEALNIVMKNVINIPFILISATVSEKYLTDIIDAGASGNIFKDRPDLLPAALFHPADKDVVIERLKLSEASSSNENPGKQENNKAAEMPLYDLCMLEEMDDNDYLIDIVSIFLDECPRELYEMQKALTANNADTICKLAHKLKGSAGLILATKLSDVLIQIEQTTKQGKIVDSLSTLIENAQEQYKKIEASLKKRLSQIREHS